MEENLKYIRKGIETLEIVTNTILQNQKNFYENFDTTTMPKKQPGILQINEVINRFIK